MSNAAPAPKRTDSTRTAQAKAASRAKRSVRAHKGYVVPLDTAALEAELHTVAVAR